MNYIAVLQADPDQRYQITCPDFPAIHAMACNLGAARLLAEAAIQIHIEELERHGAFLPEPSSLQEVLKREPGADAILVLVEPHPEPDLAREAVTPRPMMRAVPGPRAAVIGAA